jgi:hypothetical protein
MKTILQKFIPSPHVDPFLVITHPPLRVEGSTHPPPWHLAKFHGGF